MTTVKEDRRRSTVTTHDETCFSKFNRWDFADFRVVYGKTRTTGVYGRGGFAQVKKMIHLPTCNYYAFKRVKKKNNSGSKPQLEIVNQRSMRHRNLVTLHDFFELENHYVLVLECCDEGTLYQKIRKQRIGHLKEADTKRFFRQICNGVHHMHEKGLLHRDLKPENILLHHNEARICDFGNSNRIYTSKDPTDKKMQQVFMGTPPYMSPELIRGDINTRSNDVWCLGMVLFEMAAGYAPISTRGNFGENILETVVTRPACITNPDLWDLINRMLDKDPDRRICLHEVFKHPWLTNSPWIPPTVTEFWKTTCLSWSFSSCNPKTTPSVQSSRTPIPANPARRGSGFFCC
eukprot:Platyproteum_vivax@DN14268_c0_g1_i1.p1